VLATLLAGCAGAPVAPPRLDDRVLPASWNASTLQAARAAADAPRFADIDDPLLPALVRQALEANLDIASARATLQRARALAVVSRALAMSRLASSA